MGLCAGGIKLRACFGAGRVVRTAAYLACLFAFHPAILPTSMIHPACEALVSVYSRESHRGDLYYHFGMYGEVAKCRGRKGRHRLIQRSQSGTRLRNSGKREMRGSVANHAGYQTRGVLVYVRTFKGTRYCLFTSGCSSQLRVRILEIPMGGIIEGLLNIIHKLQHICPRRELHYSIFRSNKDSSSIEVSKPLQFEVGVSGR